MTLTPAEINAWLALYLLPLARIGGLLMVAPFTAGAYVPVRVRVMLALAITAVIVPALPADVLGAAPAALPALLLALAQQLLLGVAMGFVLQLVFNALVVAGQAIAMTMGLGFATTIDPANGVAVPVLSQFLLIFGLLLFLALDAHLALIGLLGESFRLLPLDGALGAAQWRALVDWAGLLFVGAVRIALPMLLALLVVNLAFGITSRAAPTLNLFAIGFPVSLLLGIVILLIGLPSVAETFAVLVRQGLGFAGALPGAQVDG